MSYPNDQISGDAQRALETFSSELDGALAAADAVPWAFSFGIKHVGLWRNTYPIPVSAAGYVLREGDDKYRTLGERSCTFVPQKYFDGVEALVEVIEAPDFVGWAGEPQRIAKETARYPNVVTAAMLEANANLSFYRDRKLNTDLGIALFAGTHPVNIFDSAQGTFDNDHSAAAINAAMMKAAFIRFNTRKAPNGRNMNLQPTHMFVPSALAQEAKDFLEADVLASTFAQGTDSATPIVPVRNRWKGTVELVVIPELTSSSYIYLLDANGPAPWIVQAAETPEQLMFDKSSEFYKTTGKVKVGYVLAAGAAGCLPHAIERIQITG